MQRSLLALSRGREYGHIFRYGHFRDLDRRNEHDPDLDLIQGVVRLPVPLDVVVELPVEQQGLDDEEGAEDVIDDLLGRCWDR